MRAKATVYEPGYLVVGKYQLETKLGEGGMGVVWRARNVALDSPVALKVLRATKDKELLRSRLIQEARAAAKLTHPAIVKVFDVGQTEAGDPFIVMELLHGQSLGKLLEIEGRLPAVQAVRTLLPIIDALWLAHTKGIVHRDLKPDNVFIVHDDVALQPKLLDFGIVKVQGADGQTHLTQDGDVLGSPDYMSPEQARGQDDVGAPSDLWSICVVLYEAITGRTPFKGANYNALLRQIVEAAPTSPRALSACDDELSALLMRGLSKEPSERFASMGALGRALASWLVGQGVTEDICGSTLEAKWLRGTDPNGRPGRASLASISDVWQSESGSGVRRFPGAVANTLPAPPLLATAEATTAVESSPATRRPSRSWLVGVIVVVVLGLAGFTLASRLVRRSVQASTEPSPRLEPSAVPVEASEAAPSIASGQAVQLERPVPGTETVSSAQQLARPVNSSRKQVPASPRKRGAGASNARSKPGDLISPY